jgi:hypothetical protein
MHLVKNTETAPAAPEPWVRPDVVAKHLGLCYETVRKMAADGRLPGRKLPNGARSLWFFQLSAVDTAMRTRRQRRAMKILRNATIPPNNYRGLAPQPPTQLYKLLK